SHRAPPEGVMVPTRRGIRIHNGDVRHASSHPLERIQGSKTDVGFREGLSPVARFGIALGAVLAATAIALSAGTAYLMSRYVVGETSSFTQQAVASHFGTVFRDDGFQRGLTEAEEDQLTQFVTFHFSIYNVVATQFFDRTGKIVFLYDESEVGRQIDPATLRGLDQALKGMRSSTRTSVIADPRRAVPGSTVGY